MPEPPRPESPDIRLRNPETFPTCYVAGVGIVGSKYRQGFRIDRNSPDSLAL